MEVEYTTRLHKEGAFYVAHAEDLDVSSAGATETEALSHLEEAVELFLEEAARMGTLEAILEEAGYEHIGETWQPPTVVRTERCKTALRIGVR